MILLIGFTTTAILFSLSMLHIYWALGGDWGASATVPSLNGQPLLETGLWDTLTIALALLIAAVICLGSFKYRLPFLPTWIYRIGIWAIAIVFLLRAIGEFHYVGFFRQVSDSLFAYWDSVLFTPLCFGLAAGCTILAANSEFANVD